RPDAAPPPRDGGGRCPGGRDRTGDPRGPGGHVRHEGGPRRSHGGGHQPGGRRSGGEARSGLTGDGETRVPSEGYVRLRRLWDEHRADAFPAASTQDPRLQEVALYESWLGGIAEAALAAGGRLAVAHRALLDARP